MRNKMYNYIQGNLRYQLYYSKFAFLIPSYIREQIDIRINSMNKECFNSGQCIKCGCKTTALQMCNAACEGDCYPNMFSKRVWENKDYLQYVYGSIYDEQGDQFWQIHNTKFIKV